jgi:hypothetical protein
MREHDRDVLGGMFVAVWGILATMVACAWIGMLLSRGGG